MDNDNAAFLDRLLQEAESYGWDGDFTEVVSFVRAVYQKYGAKCPPMCGYKRLEKENG